MINANRINIAKNLTEQGLVFFEMNTRMSYGCIGHIYRNKEKGCIMLFGKTFYCSDGEIALNTKTLELITDIQKEYAELTRDEKNRIIVDENGVGCQKKEVIFN